MLPAYLNNNAKLKYRLYVPTAGLAIGALLGAAVNKDYLPPLTPDTLIYVAAVAGAILSSPAGFLAGTSIAERHSENDSSLSAKVKKFAGGSIGLLVGAAMGAAANVGVTASSLLLANKLFGGPRFF